MKSSRWLIAATLATVVAALVTGAQGPHEIDRLPGRFEKPILALELVGTVDGFRTLIESYDRTYPFVVASESFRRNTYADFAFIAAYSTMWILILRRRGGRICTAGIALVVLAGAADCVEDALILKGLEQHGATAEGVALAALVKWGALALAFGALAYRFWPDREVRNGWQLFSAAIGFFYGYAAVLCAVGVLVSRPVIERSGLPITVAIVMQLALFWHERGRGRGRLV